METAELYQYFLASNGVTTDSRNCPPGAMFFALKGENFDGNKFAEKALQQGCRYAVVDDADYVSSPDMLLVEDCLTALQQLANYHRRQLGTPVIGITGTNGKTTTKELVSTVLSRRFRTLFTRGNFNNHIGVPLTLLRLTPAHQMAVVEMGANHPGEIRTLSHIAEPDYGLITNVGKAHLQGFGSFEGVIRTKGELYDFLREKGAPIFLQNENPYLQEMARGMECIRYGQTQGLEVSGKVLECSPFLSFEWTAAGSTHRVDTRLIGAYNLDNALAAVTVGRYFGVPDDDISEALQAYSPENNRSQLLCTGRNRLIVDAYNANPTSMMAALDNFRQMDAEHKMVILGDMKELGEAGTEEHRNVAEYLSRCDFDCVVLVGPEFSALHTSYTCMPDTPTLIRWLQEERPQGYTILIKGSNSMKLAALTEYL